MSFLLNSQDLKDERISGLLMKNTLNNEAPISFKKSSKFIDNNEVNKYLNRSKKKNVLYAHIIFLYLHLFKVL